ncbi:thiamine-phosphate kinase [Thermodesulfobacteriota bacterium]
MTRPKDNSEFQLIDSIRNQFKSVSEGVLLGISDDCAIIKKDEENVYLLSTDLLLEGVHFELKYSSARELGKKAACVNISDIAAMGGNPKYMLTSIAIPKTVDSGFIKEFYVGVKSVCKKYGVDLVGGDTSSSKKGLFVNITVIGEAKRGECITRCGARVGDGIFVTGNLGNSAGGLAILQNGHNVSESVKKYLTRKHLSVVPRVDEGAFLAHSGRVSSMIDISDGIGSDIRRICYESNVGAMINLGLIPVTKQLKELSQVAKKSVYDYAISGGEDYELMFTVNSADEEKLMEDYNKRFKKRAVRIGEITQGRSVVTVDNAGVKTEISVGYDHFLT